MAGPYKQKINLLCLLKMCMKSWYTQISTKTVRYYFTSLSEVLQGKQSCHGGVCGAGEEPNRNLFGYI